MWQFRQTRSARGWGGRKRVLPRPPPRLRQQDIVLNACLCHCRPPPPSYAQPHSHLVCWAYLAGSFSHCLHIPWLHFFLPAPPLCPCLPHTGILFALSTWHLIFFDSPALSLSFWQSPPGSFLLVCKLPAGGSAAITQWENALRICKKPFKLFDSAYD